MSEEKTWQVRLRAHEQGIDCRGKSREELLSALSSTRSGWRALRVGVDPWGWRSRGCTRWWERPSAPAEYMAKKMGLDAEGPGEEEVEEEVEEVDENEDDAYALREKPFVVTAKQLGERNLFHGDGVNIDDYRGIGCYVLEKLDPYGEKWVLWKTWEEYGYLVPPAFCDVPSYNYFSGAGTESLLIWPPLLLDRGKEPWLPPTPLSRKIADAVAERQREPSYTGQSNWDYGPQTIDLAKFPHRYFFYIGDNDGEGWMPWEDALQLGFRDPNSAYMSNILERVRVRREWYYKATVSLIWHSFGNHFGLPRDVCVLIAQRVMVIPLPEDALLEDFCGMCSCQTVGEDEGTRCESCQRIFCWADPCALESHRNTHRHIYRMRPEEM